MNQSTSVYDSKPWIQHYGDAIPAQLPAPQHANLAALVRAADARFAQHKAFTTCMPNGRIGISTV